MIAIHLFFILTLFFIGSMWTFKNKNKFRTDTIFLFIAVIAAIIPVDILISILTPIVVYLVTWLINLIKAKISNDTGIMGTILTTFFVPAISALAAWVGTLIQPDLNYWPLFGLGLLSVFVNEVLKQWKQSGTGEQTPADKKLIG